MGQAPWHEAQIQIVAPQLLQFISISVGEVNTRVHTAIRVFTAPYGGRRVTPKPCAESADL